MKSTLTEQYREASARNTVASDGDVSIHIATIDDAQFLYGWRQDTDAALSARPYSQEEHTDWMMDMLLDKQRVMLIGTAGGKPVGVMTLQDENNALDVNITMLQAARGKGYGTRMLTLASGTMQEYDLSAEIWRKNMATIKLFRHAGFSQDGARKSDGLTRWKRPAAHKKQSKIEP